MKRLDITKRKTNIIIWGIFALLTFIFCAVKTPELITNATKIDTNFAKVMQTTPGATYAFLIGTQFGLILFSLALEWGVCYAFLRIFSKEKGKPIEVLHLFAIASSITLVPKILLVLICGFAKIDLSPVLLNFFSCFNAIIVGILGLHWQYFKTKHHLTACLIASLLLTLLWLGQLLSKA